MWRRLALASAGVAAGLLGQAHCAAIASSSPPSRASSLAGTTAIVTGGSRGIGAACSKALAARGHPVVVVYNSGAAQAAEVVSSIERAGGRAVAIQADVSQEEQVVRLFEKADTAFGRTTPRLGVLINNAGVLGPRTELAECGTTERLLDVMLPNVAGPLICCREAEKRMSRDKGGEGGAIVQISSGSAYIGTPLLYSASKGALNSLTIGLVKPFGEAGIRLNTVSPGMTATDMVADTKKSFDFRQVPLGRLGEPEEVAAAVVWLASDDASFVSGANIRVAGGRPPGTTIG